MKIYGYEKNNEKLLELNEVSLQCDINELRELINFFKKTLEEHESVENKTDMCHSHFKDFCVNYNHKDPDVIIVTKFKN